MSHQWGVPCPKCKMIKEIPYKETQNVWDSVYTEFCINRALRLPPNLRRPLWKPQSHTDPVKKQFSWGGGEGRGREWCLKPLNVAQAFKLLFTRPSVFLSQSAAPPFTLPWPQPRRASQGLSCIVFHPHFRFMPQNRAETHGDAKGFFFFSFLVILFIYFLTLQRLIWETSKSEKEKSH